MMCNSTLNTSLCILPFYGNYKFFIKLINNMQIERRDTNLQEIIGEKRYEHIKI